MSEDPEVLVVSSYPLALACLEERREQVTSSLELLSLLPLHLQVASCWVIGGSSVYSEALGSKDTDRVFVTEILKDFQCDTFFPELGPGWAVEVGMRHLEPN